MRRRYKRVYKEEMARLKADRDFEIKQKRREEKSKRRAERKAKWGKKIKENLFNYKR